MKNRTAFNLFGLTLLVLTLTLVSAIANAQVRRAPPPPFSYQTWLKMRGNPDMLHQFPLPGAPAPATPEPALGSPNAWQCVVGIYQNCPNHTNIGYSNPLLMTDGTVIMHNESTQDWWKLTPDINGSYVNGTWSQIASLPAGYGPLYFGSAVLPDGRVIINGGEYNFGNAIWTNRGAIYDPTINLWRSKAPPAGWTNIGDASTVVLPDGTYMLANGYAGDLTPKQQALLQNSCSGSICSSIWVVVGAGKFDANSEEGWTLLPSGNVLTVDTYVFTGKCGMNSELYVDSSSTWQSAGNTPSQLADCNNSDEMGPQVLRPDGTVVAFGATTSGIAHTAIYDSSNSTWRAGPDLPTINGQNYTLADAPAALLPSGNVLFAASPGLFSSPVHFFELDRAGNISQVGDTFGASSISSYELNFLVLPSGQILATDFNSVQIYTPSGAPIPSWAPVIDTYPAVIGRGATYQLTGWQFNGLSQGAFYGDNVQAATNYPIVRLVNASTGHVFYARTSGFNTMSVAPNTPSSTNFIATGNTETGLSYLSVVANGIASEPVNVIVQ